MSVAIPSSMVLGEVDWWIQGGKEGTEANVLNACNIPEARIFNQQHLLSLTCTKLHV